MNLHKTFVSEQESYQYLERGEVDVMVADWPIVYADMRRGLISSAKFTCAEVSNEDSYGVAFPNNGNLNSRIVEVATKINTGLIEWDKSRKKEFAYHKYFTEENDEDDSSTVDTTSPQWTGEVIAAFCIATFLTMAWFGVWLRKKYLERLKAARRRAAGEEEDDEGQDPLIGGMAKAKDLKALMAQIDSLEARLVDAKVIKPKPKLLERWKTRGREEMSAIVQRRKGPPSPPGSSSEDGDVPVLKNNALMSRSVRAIGGDSAAGEVVVPVAP